MLRETGGVIVFFCFFLKGDGGREHPFERPLSLSLSFSSFKSIQSVSREPSCLFIFPFLFVSLSADDALAAIALSSLCFCSPQIRYR